MTLFDVPSPFIVPEPDPVPVGLPEVTLAPINGHGGDGLFDASDYDDWRSLWVGMPAYDSENEKPYATINVHFSNEQERREFLKLLGESPKRSGKWLWFPSAPYLERREKNPAPVHVPANRYPIYIPSKGRADTPFTINALQGLGIPFHVVVEPSQVEAYTPVVGRDRLLVLPEDNEVGGLVVARNFVWQHALDHGHARHWMLDDNINGFYRLNSNWKTKVTCENPFSSVEDWVDRYENVPIAGLNYEFLVKRWERKPAVSFNTRVYSCYLIDTEIAAQYKWRGPYNDDTDFCLRLLKDGYVTALFNHFLCKKLATMRVAGGNTDDLYQGDGRLKMAEALVEWHPDVARVTWKWDRWQHHVDYSSFKGNALIPREATP